MSCDIKTLQEIRNFEAGVKTDKAPDVSSLPPEKLEAIKAYTAMLRRKFPQMKKERLQRKVAEHFKIKLA